LPQLLLRMRKPPEGGFLLRHLMAIHFGVNTT